MFRESSDPAEVIWAYLAEVPRMVDGGGFEVFTHIDYAARYWPAEQHGPFDPLPFEDGYRQAMRAIAASDRPLEMNTGHGLRRWVPQWWAEEGGRASPSAATITAPTGWPPTSPRRPPCWSTSAFGPVGGRRTSGPAERSAQRSARGERCRWCRR